MENKTAVERCIDQFKDWLNHELGHDHTAMMLLEQIENGALTEYIEMEKQQIITARVTAPILPLIDKSDYEAEAEEYYCETYKKPTQ
jgi:hypothetical protein